MKKLIYTDLRKYVFRDGLHEAKPDVVDVSIVSAIMEEVVEELGDDFDRVGLGKPINIAFAQNRGDMEGFIGKYFIGTTRNPIILLNMDLIYFASESYDVTLDIVIRTTITHEIGHAIMDMNGQEQDEDYPENFAWTFENEGRFLEIEE